MSRWRRNRAPAKVKARTPEQIRAFWRRQAEVFAYQHSSLQRCLVAARNKGNRCGAPSIFWLAVARVLKSRIAGTEPNPVNNTGIGNQLAYDQGFVFGKYVANIAASLHREAA